MEAGNNAGRTKPNADYLSSKKPFYFAADLPEGHYRVLITLGGSADGSSTTLKTESRRLLFENVKTASGETVQKMVVVDVRYPQMKKSGGH